MRRSKQGVLAGALAALACGGSGQGDGTTTTATGDGSTGASTVVTGGDTTAGGGDSGSTDTGGDETGATTGGTDELPTGLPFEFSRPTDGRAPTDTEIADFTRAITGLWAQTDYFRWITWHGHGLDASYDPKMPPFAVWWQDTTATKVGEAVVFTHVGGADNIMIRTPKTLTQALYGHASSGDPAMTRLSIDFSRGVVAMFRGMAWGGEDPPVESVAARAIFTHNHSYTTWDGRQVAVDYDPVKVEVYDWNAHTVPNPDNPHYGSIWIRNMRSKDDVPHLYRLVPVLRRLAQDATDPEVAAEAAEADAFLTAFAQDIVDHDYGIRTKEDGMIYVPTEDLAHLTQPECPARLATDLVATGTSDKACGTGFVPQLEALAVSINYFNRAILEYFHAAAIANALVTANDDIALELMGGMAERADWLAADTAAHLAENPEWEADRASFLLVAAAAGLPLTGAEAHHVIDAYTAAVAHYETWPNWDLWDPSVAEGPQPYLPPRSDVDAVYVRPEELAFAVHYCATPWRNPATVEMLDCDIVLDPARWGR